MTTGRSLRMFLVDGTSSGLITAEIMNWTGHILTGPRSMLAELLRRNEIARTGVYFLIGSDLENPARVRVYIGETDDVAARLKQHNRSQEQGGKDFWERVCVVTSKDFNLTKAHVKHLESRLLEVASEARRCVLDNGNAPVYGALPEADIADMAFFLEQIRTVLPVIGFDFLRVQPLTSNTKAGSMPTSTSIGSPLFVMEVRKFGVEASARELDGDFIVLAGSTTRDQWSSEWTGYKPLFDQLVLDGVLSEVIAGLRKFNTDYAFSSPSAAAAIVSGRPANGRTSWTSQGSGETYAHWQEQQVNQAVTPEPKAKSGP
jgi:hypothetical protein